MKKVFLFCMIICVQNFISCTQDEKSLKDYSGKNIVNNFRAKYVISGCRPLDIKSNVIVTNAGSIISSFSFKLSAYGRSKKIYMYKLSSGNYAYDLDRDGQIDFQIQPLSEDSTQAYYLDRNGKIFGKGSVEILGDQSYLRYKTALPENGSTDRHPGETWSDCFRREWSDPVKVAIVVIEPELAPAVLEYVAVDCLFCSDCEQPEKKEKQPDKH